MMQNELLMFIDLMDKRFEVAGIPYMLTGSVAMTFYAVPRMTRDIDVVIHCDLNSVDSLIGLFAVDCYVDREEAVEALRSGSMFNIIHNESLVKADLIPRKSGEFRELEFTRRRRVSLLKGSCWIVSPEDLILSKLDWSRTSASELQRRDVAALLTNSSELDWDYLEKWAGRLDLTGELERARRS